MKCYDCGGEIAVGIERCSACNCPSDPGQALGCLEARLLAEEVDAESALDQLGRAKIAMLCAGGLALVNAVMLFTWAGSGSTLSLLIAGLMILLAGGYVVLALLIRKAPLPLSIVGLVMSSVFFGGLLGIVIAGAMALSVWFAVQHMRTENRIGLLKRNIDLLKKCTEHSI